MLSRREGALPAERLPLILEVAPNADYALIDSGDGEKLEQYGPYRIVRPEGQAIWRRALPPSEWERADAIFTGDTDEEGLGRWRFPKTPLGETWPMKHDGIDYLGRFTSFRHVGVFPEQASHWDHMAGLIEQAKRPVKVLNLFGYTGLASLVAARAGAEVTHVDASKKAIGWARENQEMAGLSQKPIRWICEDAMKFAEREARRGSLYDIVLFDPPAYGRGPKGEVWQLFEDLPALTDLCRADTDAKTACRGADGLFDPGVLLCHPCADARQFRRHGRHGRIRRTDHPRKIGGPGAVDLAVLALDRRMIPKSGSRFSAEVMRPREAP